MGGKRMKKILLVLLCLFTLTACGTKMNTPTEKVEEFLSKYQKMDTEVLNQLDTIIQEESSMSESQKKDYQALLEKQYQNLSYKIKDEKIKDSTATVDVEIEVYDYATSIRKSREYYNTEASTTNDSSENGLIDTISEFIDYKIKQLQNVTEKVKYDLTFNLTKENGKWELDDISDIDIEKIHGLYEE